jgi:hypothetical protein
MAAERARLQQIDADNAARARFKANERARRRGNIDGIRAAKRKQWARAIQLFEAALARDPNDRVIAGNLEQARAALSAPFDGAATSGSAVTVVVTPAPPTEPRLTTSVAISATVTTLTPTPIVIPAPPTPPAPAGSNTDVGPAPSVPAPAIPLPSFPTSLRPAIDLGGALEMANEINLYVVAQFVPFGGNALSFHDQIKDTQETRAKYSELVTKLVDEVAQAAHDTVTSLGSGDGEASVDHVLDAPRRMSNLVYQFAEERIRMQLLGKITDWAKHRAHRSAEQALKKAVAP